MKAVIYARFSSDNQREESIDAQVRAIREYAVRNKILIVHVYADEAKSATTDQRPEFQQMVRDSASCDWQAVIVHKLDRFSRDRYDSAYYKRQLTINGVRLISVLENLDDSPESVILESVLEGMAEYYSKNLAREVMKGMKETALACKNTGGAAPYGFCFDSDRRLAIVENEAPIVQMIFDLYTEGHGYKAIIDVLNAHGAVTRTGRSFSPSAIREMLLNPKYAGIYTYNRRTSKVAGRRNNHVFKPADQVIQIKGGCPAIVSESAFQAARDRMAKNVHCGGRFSAKRVYLLTGRIHCGECGSPMSGTSVRNGKGSKYLYYYYMCNKKQRNADCHARRINADLIEGLILDTLYRQALTPDCIDFGISAITESVKQLRDSAGDRIASLRRQLSGVETKINNVVAVIADGLYSPALKAKLADLEAQRDDLTRQLAVDYECPVVDISPDVIKARLANHPDLRTIPPIKQRNVIESLVSDVVVYEAHVDLTVDYLNFISGGQYAVCLHHP